MLRQADNKAYIEGILSEVDLREGTFEKEGRTVEYISGEIKIKVTNQEIAGVKKDIEVPVSLYATKLTKKNTPNPSYKSILAVKNELVSIAAAGGEAGADYVRISGSVIENAFPNKRGEITSYPKVKTGFVTKIAASDCKPRATFNVEFAVASKDFEVDKEGVETGRYIVKAIIPQYGGKVDVVDFICVSPSVIDAVSRYWTIGDTFKAQGKLNFTSSTRTVKQEVEFGEAEERTFTSYVSEMIITGGSQTAVDPDLAFDTTDIKGALAERKARFEDMKNKTTRTVKPVDTGFNANDLGF